MIAVHETKYGKTENLLIRNEETHKCPLGGWRDPATVLQILRWLVTEKLDGMNGRVILDWAQDVTGKWNYFVDVRGRSDGATLHKDILPEAFGVADPNEMNNQVFSALKCLVGGGESAEELTAALLESPKKMVVYGEFVGPGIQKDGAKYAPQKTFMIYDVVTWRLVEDDETLEHRWVGSCWWPFEQVEQVAEILGLQTVPVVSYHSDIDSIIEMVVSGLPSMLGDRDAEGVVARTDPYLYDSRHNRVFFKLKGKDLA